LIDTMPDGLDTVFLVNSGSEANDLAWRLATTFTGGDGALVTAYAYHGVTKVIADLSPETWVNGEPPTHVVTIPPPQDDPSPDGYAAFVDEAVAMLRSRGVTPAAMFLDPGFTSDGVFAPPAGVLTEAVRHWRDAGGLFVADEVQTGFGRPGSAMWGFAAHGLVPDVVTLGKPMGNGHPVAAVITRADIVDRFAGSTEWFSTFGGNPVACEAALAVLDVLEDEALLPHVIEVGRHLRERLTHLMAEHDVVGDVRTLGLLAGVEFLGGVDDREPNPDAADAIANAMRERGVLVGTTGRLSNVLKIRPPLVISRAEIDLLVDRLAGALRADRGPA
jgi:4-aminobutyrate aminotransferase-like enzyme